MNDFRLSNGAWATESLIEELKAQVRLTRALIRGQEVSREMFHNTKRLFLAAILSSPSNKIDITLVARELASGPLSDWEIVETEDIGSNVCTYSARRR